MKIGIKSYDHKEFLNHFDKKFDFLEVMAIESSDYSFLNELSKPIVIHAQHQKFGINNADKTKISKNKSSIDYAIKIADQIKAKKIILHPGEIDDKNCSKEQAISFLKTLKDKRILLENLPSRGNHLCSTPEETAQFMKETGLGLCFDVNHALTSALNLGKEPYSFIKEFLNLKPKHYHLGGQKIDGKITIDHLNFQDSNIDLQKIMSMFPKDAEISLETTQDIAKCENDLLTMKKFI